MVTLRRSLAQFGGTARAGSGREFLQRKFPAQYNVQQLSSGTVDPASRVCISTIQRFYSILRGEELDPDLDELSAYEIPGNVPVPVQYSAALPPEAFDIIIDECHRSIYGCACRKSRPRHVTRRYSLTRPPT